MQPNIKLTHLSQTSSHLASSTNMNNSVAPSSYVTSLSSMIHVLLEGRTLLAATAAGDMGL